MDDEMKSGPNPLIAIVVSIAAFTVSSITLYFTYFYTSESLYMLFLDSPPGSSMLEGLKGTEKEKRKES